MVPTAVVITIIVAAAAIVVTAILALVNRIGKAVDDLATRVTAIDERLTGRLDTLHDDFAGLRASVGTIEGRLTTLESSR